MTSKTRKNRRATGRTTPGAVDAKRREYFQKYLYYLDGLAFYADAECPEEEKPFIRMGWGIGRQMVSQYVVEMLLRIRFKKQGSRRTETHNLAHLYKMLPEDDKNAVEKVYKRILNAEVAWTWDVYETVASFLDFLGKNPIKHTKYPWQQQHVGTLYSPTSYRALIYALFIGLHGYPPGAKGSLDKRFDTEFRSFQESRKDRYGSKGNRITE